MIEVGKLQEKGWEVKDRTTYLVQEEGSSGWVYTIGEFNDLDSAVAARYSHLQKWYDMAECDLEMLDYMSCDDHPVRIVMRHTVEVVL